MLPISQQPTPAKPFYTDGSSFVDTWFAPVENEKCFFTPTTKEREKEREREGEGERMGKESTWKKSN